MVEKKTPAKKPKQQPKLFADEKQTATQAMLDSCTLIQCADFAGPNTHLMMAKQSNGWTAWLSNHLQRSIMIGSEFTRPQEAFATATTYVEELKVKRAARLAEPVAPSKRTRQRKRRASAAS